MNSHPPLSSEFTALSSDFLSANDLQSGEFNVSPPLFYQDSIHFQPDLIFNALDFSQHAPSDKCKDYPKPSEGVDKKLMHMATERERRKDLKSRYAELRSLLPQEYIRGKTSITDQLSQAIDYISHLREIVDELAKKRDEMKMKRNTEDIGNAMPLNESEVFPLVNVNHVGSRVVVTTNAMNGQILFSKLLHALEEEGLQVLTASSFCNDGKAFHTVHCKVGDVQRFKNGGRLHQKLWQLIGQTYISNDCVTLVQS